jgi:hypothetical protein
MVPDILELQRLVREAELVEAYNHVRKIQAQWTHRVGSDDVEGLRFHCLAAEVLDHAGKYKEAGILIRRVGMRCKESLDGLAAAPGAADRSL